MGKLHLKGLDTFRGVAAMIVLISHIELLKKNSGYSNIFHLPFYEYTAGHTSVILFFCISGFLITLLLINEKTAHKKISLKNFYLRRIFRVWPLYYLVIIASYFLLDYPTSTLTLLLCLSIFPNVATALGIPYPGSPQIWSIGVEEQFYLVWPIMVKIVRNIFWISLGAFVFFTFFPHVLLAVLQRIYPDPATISFIDKFFFGTKFSCMAIGALAAVIYHKKKQWVNLLNKNLIISYVFIALPFILWFIPFHTPLFQDEIYGILFSLSILIMVSNPKVINIDFVIPKFIGKISYGIYMYHHLILVLLLRYLKNISNDLVWFNILLYVFAIIITILVSTLSYYFIEKPFLKLKEKYSR